MPDLEKASFHTAIAISFQHYKVNKKMKLLSKKRAY